MKQIKSPRRSSPPTSTVSGALNSISATRSLSTSTSRAGRPRASEKRLTRIGRLVTFAGMVDPLVSPMVSHFQSLFQAMASRRRSPLFIWRPVEEGSAAAAQAPPTDFGSALFGLAVFFLDWFKATTGWAVPSMMATFILFLVCSAVRRSCHTAESEKLELGAPHRGGWGPGILDYRLVSLILFLAMVGLYAVFG